jgi:hypothetical protein
MVRGAGLGATTGLGAADHGAGLGAAVGLGGWEDGHREDGREDTMAHDDANM